jgi:site-specific DNA-cytosine methylase
MCLTTSRCDVSASSRHRRPALDPRAAAFRFITRHLRRLCYHWRVRVLDAAKLGAAQQRLRVYFVCSLEAAVLATFS